MPFQVGDGVKVREGAPYRITTPGSYGTVTRVLSVDYYIVKFKYLASGLPHHRQTFDISGYWLELLEPLSFEEQLTRTIQRLHHRQQFYQAHKDELPSWG